MKLLIGVTGFKQNGKSTITKVLAAHGFTLYAFADALREIARLVNPMISLEGAPPAVFNAVYDHVMWAGDVAPRSMFCARWNTIIELVGYERAKEIPDFRGFLQRLGTEGIRGTFGPNAWVEALARQLDREKPELVAISDVRFSSEAEFIRAQGGHLWRVIRPGVGGDDPHPSEVEIPHLPADREFINNDSLATLERAVIDALAVVRKSAGL